MHYLTFNSLHLVKCSSLWPDVFWGIYTNVTTGFPYIDYIWEAAEVNLQLPEQVFHSDLQYVIEPGNYMELFFNSIHPSKASAFSTQLVYYHLSVHLLIAWALTCKMSHHALLEPLFAFCFGISSDICTSLVAYHCL